MTQFKQIGQLMLVSATLFGLAHFPAKAETAPVQTSAQDAVISGDNNQVNQTINQTIIYHPGRGLTNRLENKEKKGNGQSSSERNHENRGNHYGANRDN